MSLVALFGPKQARYPHLWDLVVSLQGLLSQCLGPATFRPYDEHRVHATLVGLEGHRFGRDVYARLAHADEAGGGAMDLAGLLQSILADKAHLPLRIRIGGFDRRAPYPFESRGQSPYLRSFSIQGDIAVCMGWPVQGDSFPPSLDRLRRSFNRFNVWHKYHDSASARDNDFFFVLGHLSGAPPREVLDDCSEALRDSLSGLRVPALEISVQDLSVLAYPDGDTRLTRAHAFPLPTVLEHLDAFIDFYPAGQRPKRA